MTEATLTKTRFVSGVWEGVLEMTPENAAPTDIVVRHLGTEVPDVTVTQDEVNQGRYWVKVPIPVTAIGDGIQTFVFHARADDTVLNSFALVAGEPLADDLRAEIDLLRAELDMLKKAFRRHCVETM
ncbi:hypothetical protein [Rhodovulum sp. FJ3]|uniref:hypothetical protein n=1 Tax=Rhodovulum sp. FJ3 TaxID=3079053 RepID=UPI00293DBF6F|nr:hypothetical protein [Rhodovulum sp. FJ3]MDV4168815.1 hypothetical protein [Rhodovulum sp. FJ3]